MTQKLGIIGCGAVIHHNYVPTLGRYDDIEVKYVFDINADLANIMASTFNAKSTSKDELIHNSDIIVIATPPSTHYQLVKDAIAPGKKIICEKPFVGTVEEATDLIALAKSGGAELYVAHFRRCYPSMVLARSIISSGVLGEVTGIEAYEGGKFSWKTQSGYIYKDPFGGVLFDTGSHTIDMALFIANLDAVEMAATLVSVKKDKEEPAHEVEAKLKLKALNKDIDFKVKLSRRLLMSNKIRVTCTNGYIEVPTVLESYVRLWGKNSSTVLYSNVVFGDLMDCFAMQFKDMFYSNAKSVFKAELFVNLTRIMETIANN